jgi:hypothetical protein
VCEPVPPAGNGISVSLLNPANRLKVTAGLDALMVLSSKRVFPSGIPLFLYPDSPFGLDTNEFDAHARQSYVGGLFSGPELCGFQTGAQVLTFFQYHDLSARNVATTAPLLRSFSSAPWTWKLSTERSV